MTRELDFPCIVARHMQQAAMQVGLKGENEGQRVRFANCQKHFLKGRMRTMKSNNRNAFTLIEILIVVVIMAVLAATIIPQFTDSSDDAKESTALYNLTTLRGQVELYKAQHYGGLPGNDLSKLTTTTTNDGTVSDTGPYGPYLPAIPENTISGSNAVKVITTAAPVAGDVTADNAGGWIYSSATGGIWLDHATYYTK